METQLVNVKTPVDHVFCNRGCEERFYKYRVRLSSGTLHVVIHPTSGQVVLIIHSPLTRDRAELCCLRAPCHTHLQDEACGLL